MSDKPEPICAPPEATGKMSETPSGMTPGQAVLWHAQVDALADKAIQLVNEKAVLQRRIAAALDYIELHMSEDADFDGERFVPNDALSLRSILDGSAPS